MLFNFDNTYAKQLEGFYSSCQSAVIPSPKLIKLNGDLAAQLNLNLDSSTLIEQLKIFSGNELPQESSPLAQVYAGHQFGGFSPQLGDGRALLLGEVLDKNGKRFDIQLKGSGRTPYSRGGDGKAGVGPVLREYILSEAMHALGIPTTRALAAVATGEMIMRERPIPGAVLTRVASSHIRIGTFQFFASRGEVDKVRQLADYTIARHYPEIMQSDNPYLKLLEKVCDSQALLVCKWMLIGFVHGVMNTDNMTVSGETIDYGPCAFIDSYNPEAVYSSIDKQGRYAFQNQPPIAQWNLARLAETLLPLINSDQEHGIELVTSVLNKFPEKYSEYWLDGMRSKLGLKNPQEGDMEIMNDLLAQLHENEVDYTNFFRELADVLLDNRKAVHKNFTDIMRFEQWLVRWKDRLSDESIIAEESVQLMNQVNPIYIPRNHKVEEAIEAAILNEDYSKFEMLLEVLSQPYFVQSGKNEYSQPAPKEFGIYKTFCGT
ncbi:MAG: YdiU family protein [Gammaproteobacteria bacterium]|nr:YdiU family protein [Gammaproteobacteria bacterium]